VSVGRRLVVALVCVGVLAPVAVADAVNRRVSIGDFQWSTKEVVIDLNEKVTWYWIGPDTQHSVGPVSGNTSGIDSDPGSAAPNHFPGFEFTGQFKQPGTFDFVCKLHAIVRGRVIVSATPGNPDVESPDPIPVINVDRTAPSLTEARWTPSNALRRGRGTLAFSLDERARIVFDVEKLVRGRWRLAGTRTFDGHVGWNEYEFGGVLKQRRLAKGRYKALLVAADAENNRTGDIVVPFTVR